MSIPHLGSEGCRPGQLRKRFALELPAASSRGSAGSYASPRPDPSGTPGANCRAYSPPDRTGAGYFTQACRPGLGKLPGLRPSGKRSASRRPWRLGEQLSRDPFAGRTTRVRGCAPPATPEAPANLRIFARKIPRGAARRCSANSRSTDCTFPRAENRHKVSSGCGKNLTLRQRRINVNLCAPTAATRLRRAAKASIVHSLACRRLIVRGLLTRRAARSLPCPAARVATGALLRATSPSMR